MRVAAAAALIVLAGCSDHSSEAAHRADPGPNAAGLVTAPCHGPAPLRPAAAFFCTKGRNYMTQQARAALIDAAEALNRRYPRTILTFMDASGPDGRKPFKPHLSHGDGRQIDLADFYQSRSGRRLAGPPPASRAGYGAFEPPRPGDPLPCRGIDRPNDDRDPPADRIWRLDDERTATLVKILVADPRVRRVFIEPHLKRRFGLSESPKVRFAGCQAARHDDHIHVDFR